MDASLAPCRSGTSQPGVDYTPLDVQHGEARLQTLQQGMGDAAREIHQREADQQVARMKREPVNMPKECSHPEWKRHGNKYGSYATCTLCHTRVK